MTLVTTLTLVYETKDNAHYAESPDADETSLLGTLSIQKWALPRPAPSTIRLTLEPYELERPTPAVRPRGAAASTGARATADATTSALRKGATVEIVKNRLAGIHQPPEWLEQYLGRRGTVLWTTVGGAMVKLESGATWFPYAELLVVD
jgi:hypothetical protein